MVPVLTPDVLIQVPIIIILQQGAVMDLVLIQQGAVLTSVPVTIIQALLTMMAPVLSLAAPIQALTTIILQRVVVMARVLTQ